MRTAVVILNWNTREYLEKFLPPLLAYTKGADVIVADSASTDGSMRMMEERFPNVPRIELDENYGFTGGYNRAFNALKDKDYEYYLLLNSDVLVTGNWLEPLVEWMDRHPDCGACAPKLHSYYDRENFEYAGAAGGMMDPLGYSFCRGRVMGKVETDNGQYDSPANVFWVTGACMMTRAKLYHELGGLDERFFAHFEEIDLCWRMQLQGFKVTVVPQSLVYHLGGGTLPSTSPWKLKLNFRNNLLTLSDNLARTLALDLFHAGTSVGKAARKGFSKARRRIFLRQVLDGLSAAVYLVCLKTAYFRAVLDAHNEYRKLRKEAGIADIARWLDSCGHKAEVHGRYPNWMIPRAVLGRKMTLTENTVKP